MNYKILHGDVIAMLKTLPDNSVDAVVTDPPYEIGFMGRTWDGSGIAYSVEMWSECLRVLKPGGHLLSFGGSRTYHRMACAVEDAGFEIRDEISYFYSSDVDRNAFLDSLSPQQQEMFLEAFGRPSTLSWTFGSGFPKSHSVAKAIHPAVESRYGQSKCDCMDSGNGLSSRENIRCGGGEEIRFQRASSDSTTPQIINSDLSLDAERCGDSLRELRETCDAKEQGFEKIKTPLLQEDMCGFGTKDKRLGHASLWAGVEKCEGGDTQEGQGLSGVQQDSEGERECSTSTPFETVQVRRNEQSQEPSGTMRVVPSSNRENNRTGSSVDSDRRGTRRVILDDLCGWDSAVAYVCSWCALPSQEWLDTISSLGTALKPAHEPIVLARKPLIGTVVSNVLQYGTGALNIAACRIPGEPVPINKLEAWSGFGQEVRPEYKATMSDVGRWPSNLIHDGSDEVLDEFAKYGVTSSGAMKHEVESYDGENVTGFLRGRSGPSNQHGDSGSVARFFYCAKASREDRNEGCEELELKPLAYGNQAQDEVKRGNNEHSGNSGMNTVKMRGNNHPTVKPTDLMRYLCKMITPPGGTVLDCFMGSGSTGKAALIEGFNFIGIEKDENYCAISKARMEHVLATDVPLLRAIEVAEREAEIEPQITQEMFNF